MACLLDQKEFVSLYFHIPLCRKKCPYCHFYVIPNEPRFKQVLVEAFQLEWKQKLPLLLGKEIASIYFGGGTPTLLGSDGIDLILSLIRESGWASLINCEITMESNPEDSREPLLKTLRALGINRFSIGVQSLDNSSLTSIERAHTANRAKEAIFEASRSGFKNISIDLMYDLPNQTQDSWDNTLNQLSDLPIQHLSLYNLTIEPHTSFYKRRTKLSIPNDDASFLLLQTAVDRIETSGLKRYEISAFAKHGFQSLHNTGYWTGRPFLGFGPSAFSYWKGERFRNIANVQRYARSLRNGISPIDFRERLGYPQNLAELLAIRLRLLEGAHLQLFSPLPKQLSLILKKWTIAGYLEQEKNVIRLTEKGVLFYDTIAEEIIGSSNLD